MNFRKPSILANPAFIYIFIWSIVLILFFMGLTNQLVEPSYIGIILIFSGFFTAIVAYIFSTIIIGKNIYISSNSLIINTRSFSTILIKIWIIGTIADIIYSGGIPFIWALMGNGEKNYTNFGIPSAHGILNACYLQAIVMRFYCWLIDHRKKDAVLILILLIWPVLMLGRGILLGALIQMTALFLMNNRISIKGLLKITALILLIIYIFGILGDIRGSHNPFEYLITDESKNIFNSLPNGFIWVYVYITCGINNIFHNIDLVNPSYLPVYSITNMIPSVLKSLLNIDPRADSFTFVDNNLNISTNYAGALSDFGPIGAMIFIYIIQQLISNTYVKARYGNLPYLMAYTAMFQVLVFSAFYDLFFLLPTLMQFFIAYIFSCYLKRVNNSINTYTA